VDRVGDPLVLVLAPGAAEPVLPERLAARVLVARDGAAHEGPLAGLANGLAALPAGIDRAIVVAGDMPTLVPGVLRALLELLEIEPDAGVACLEAEPLAPLPMAVRSAIAAPAARALLADGRRSLRGLVAAVPAIALPLATWRGLDPAGDTLRDVDTRADLEGLQTPRRPPLGGWAGVGGDGSPGPEEEQRPG
jgi:molybdopterin-guanine dinucleotide biosynthesis protein A